MTSYLADTVFLTKDGWKKFDEVGTGSELATIYTGRDIERIKWGQIEHLPLLEKSVGRFTGNLYGFLGTHTEVWFPPNYRALCREVEKNNDVAFDWELKEVSRLTNCFDVLQIIQPRTTTFSNLPLFANLPLKPRSFLSLMGWFLSDGTFGFGDTANQDHLKLLSISQIKGGKLHLSMARFADRYADAVDCRLAAYDRPADDYHPEPFTEMSLQVKHKPLIERIYADCGHSKAKRIPRYVFGLSKHLMEVLFDAMVRGDGTIKHSKGANEDFEAIVYYSSVEGLANDMNELAVRCGWRTSLWGPYNYIRKGKPTTMYQVYVNKNVDRHKRLSWSQNVQKRPVENLELVSLSTQNGTIITRQKGRVFFGGC